MARLEDLAAGVVVRGILPDSLVTVVNLKMHGTAVAELTYQDALGRLGHELLFRDREPTLAIVEQGRPWSFDGDGALFRLVSEASRIRLAHLFDPVLAVHTSLVDPLPTRSRPCTARCSRGSRSGSSWPTIRAPARRSWPDCSLRSCSSAAICSVVSSVAPAASPSNGRMSWTGGSNCLSRSSPARRSRPPGAGTPTPSTTSRRLQFVEIDEAGLARAAGPAPYLDYRPLAEDERALVDPLLDSAWLRDDLESRALSHAIAEIVPGHFAEVRQRKDELVNKTLAAVKDRLTKEITYWDHRAEDLKAQEAAGRVNARLNSGLARQRADDLATRLQNRLQDLEQERHLSPLPPIAIGGALVVPAGLLARRRGERSAEPATFARETARVERLAMEAVLAAERRWGHLPRDVRAEKRGYDIESRDGQTGRLRFIEVKGRAAGARTVTVTKNEILTALNKPDDFSLAVVEVDGESAREPVYLRRPFGKEPDFGVTSVTYDLSRWLARGEAETAVR